MKSTLIAMIALIIFCGIAAATDCITMPGFVAAVFIEDLNEAVFYAKSKRYSDLTRMISLKRAIMLQPNNSVSIELESDDGSKIFIRKKGEDIGVWTIREAVRCKEK